MPTIYFKGDVTHEQAIGNTLNSGFMKAYAVRKDQPLEMIFLGGHRIDDAPSYTISEAKIDPEYRHLNGRNILIEKTLVNDYVKSIAFNLMLPNKLISVTDRIYQFQDNFEYDLLITPSTCEEGCAAFFWLGQDLTLGARQITNSVIGFDENENPITSMRTLRTAGQLLGYHGLIAEFLTARAGALYDVKIVHDDCDPEGCPYQHIVVVGINGDAAFSLDGGATWTTITTTTITTDLVGADLSSVVYSNGNYVIGYTDAIDADGTDGGLAYSVNGAAAVLSTILQSDGVTPATSLGIQWIIPAFNKLYAGGGGATGEMYYSCDDGVTWIEIDLPAGLSTFTLLSAAFDEMNRILYIGAEDGEAWAYNGKTFTEISTQVGAAATTDLLTTAVTAPGHVGFGGSDGILYQNFEANDLTSSYGQDVLSTNPLQGLVGDGFTYRTLVGSANTILLRDALSQQVFELKETLTGGGNVMASTFGRPLKDEGVNFFLFVTDTGNVVALTQCGLCLETDC